MLAALFLLLSLDSASLLHKQGLEAAAQGKYRDAATLYQKAADAWRELGADYRKHLAVTLANLGQARQSSGDWRGAIDAYRDAVTLSPAPAILSRLGGALAAVGETAEAESLLIRALAVQAEDDLETAGTLNNLAILYAQLGRWEKAEPLVARAVSIFNRADGGDSPESAMLLSNLASLHLHQGRPERAAPLFRKARRTLENKLGKEHSQVATVLSQEGLLLLNEGKIQLAIAELTEAVRILRRSAGEDSLDTSLAETNLALAQLRAGRTEDACVLLEHSFQVQQRLYATETRELRITRESLGRCEAARSSLRAGSNGTEESKPTTQPQAARESQDPVETVQP